MLRQTHHPPSLSLAGQFFVSLNIDPKRLAFPKAVARALWDIIAASDDPEAQAFCFNTSVVVEKLRGGAVHAHADLIEAYFQSWLTPDLLAEAVTELARREEIPAPVAARLQARIDRWSTPHGEWLW